MPAERSEHVTRSPLEVECSPTPQARPDAHAGSFLRYTQLTQCRRVVRSPQRGRSRPIPPATTTTVRGPQIDNYVMTICRVVPMVRRLRGPGAVSPRRADPARSTGVPERSAVHPLPRDLPRRHRPHTRARTDRRATRRAHRERSPTRSRSDRVHRRADARPTPTADSAGNRTGAAARAPTARAGPSGTTGTSTIPS